MAKAKFQDLRQAQQFNALQETFQQWLREAFSVWDKPEDLARTSFEEFLQGNLDDRGRVHNNVDDQPLHRAAHTALAIYCFDQAMKAETSRFLANNECAEEEAELQVVSTVTHNAQRFVGDQRAEYNFKRAQAALADMALSFVMANDDSGLKDYTLIEIEANGQRTDHYA